MKKQGGSALATKIDIKLAIISLEEKLEKRFSQIDENAKKYRDDILTKLDPVVAEIESARLDRELGASQTSQLREQI
ncbi:MAG: hypothetical protein HY426_03240 [Candidatus Levybacteria bacterium]|nr:hypothetical protein [Candidatus Levybacteria bacterium]